MVVCYRRGNVRDNKMLFCVTSITPNIAAAGSFRVGLCRVELAERFWTSQNPTRVRVTVLIQLYVYKGSSTK